MTFGTKLEGWQVVQNGCLVVVGGAIACVVATIVGLFAYAWLGPPAYSHPGKTIKGWGCSNSHDGNVSASVYYNMTFSANGEEILLNYFGHKETLIYQDNSGDKWASASVWKGPTFTYLNDAEEHLWEHERDGVSVGPSCGLIELDD